MPVFAIRNKHTGEWLCGTDYNHDPPQQITSKDQMTIFNHPYTAEFEFEQRKCGDDFEIVKVDVTATDVIERIGSEERWSDFKKFYMSRA